MMASRLGSRGVAIAGIAVMALLSVSGFSLLRTEADQTTVYAWFRDASPLIEGNDVKMHGVKVGVIDSIEVADGKAKVGIRLDPAARPLYVDARAVVRPVGLLGERYVDLHRGSADQPMLPTGGDIPVERTGAATDLDQVLNTVDEPTGVALAALVTTLGEGMQGTGTDVSAAIKALEPAMRDTGPLVEVLREQTELIAELVDSLEPLTGGLTTEDGRRLDRMVGAADVLLGATAKNQAALDQTLVELPTALAEARRTLRILSRTARATTPTLHGLRPITDQLVRLSRELTAFARAAGPALDGLDPVLVQGQALLDHARPVAESLHRSGPDLSGAARGARPVVTGLLGNLRNVLDFVKYWALSTNGEDGLSHYFRAHFVVTEDPAQTLVPLPLGDEPKPPSQPSPADLLPELPIPSLPLPGLGDVLLGGDESLLGPLLGRQKASGDPDSATGLTAQQEQSLLDSLIGGQ